MEWLPAQLTALQFAEIEESGHTAGLRATGQKSSDSLRGQIDKTLGQSVAN